MNQAVRVPVIGVVGMIVRVVVGGPVIVVVGPLGVVRVSVVVWAGVGVCVRDLTVAMQLTVHQFVFSSRGHLPRLDARSSVAGRLRALLNETTSAAEPAFAPTAPLC